MPSAPGFDAVAGSGSLLERIRHGEIRDDIEARVEPVAVARSVGRNIERLLNAWAGSALIDPALGMPDDAFFGSDSAAIGRRVADEIVRNVKACEQRLADVTVRALPPEDRRVWVFELHGRLVTATGRPRVLFQVERDEASYRVVF